MKRTREWSYCGYELTMEEMACCITGNVKAMLRILELMEDEVDPELSQTMHLLLQSTWAYAELIDEAVIAEEQ